jgi:hypothetical protein
LFVPRDTESGHEVAVIAVSSSTTDSSSVSSDDDELISPGRVRALRPCIEPFDPSVGRTVNAVPARNALRIDSSIRARRSLLVVVESEIGFGTSHSAQIARFGALMRARAD